MQEKCYAKFMQKRICKVHAFSGSAAPSSQPRPQPLPWPLLPRPHLAPVQALALWPPGCSCHVQGGTHPPPMVSSCAAAAVVAAASPAQNNLCSTGEPAAMVSKQIMKHTVNLKKRLEKANQALRMNLLEWSILQPAN
jgi:hypothetical protein